MDRIMNRIKFTRMDGRRIYIDMDSIISIDPSEEHGNVATELIYSPYDGGYIFVVKESVDEVLELEKKGKNE